jgi:putative endonuclease
MVNYFVYIAPSHSGTLYVRMANDLVRRIGEHKEGRVPGFSSTYGVDRLVDFEQMSDVWEASAREKHIEEGRFDQDAEPKMARPVEGTRNSVRGTERGPSSLRSSG